MKTLICSGLRLSRHVHFSKSPPSVSTGRWQYVQRHTMRTVKSKEVVVENASIEDRLQRAKDYPYPRPNSSFIFANGSAHSLTNDQWNGPLLLDEMLKIAAPSVQYDLDDYRDVEWSAVLAVGSNASAEQLARKYRNNGVIIPVVQCALVDFDVVYSPMVSSYGSCTATLQYSPGTVVEVFMTYLTPTLLERMIETEGAYNLVKLKNIDLKIGLSVEQYTNGVEPVERLDAVLQFNHQRGCLWFPAKHLGNGVSSPVSLKDIPAHNRQFPAYDQAEMLTKIMQLDDNSRTDLDAWILNNLDSETDRRQLLERLMPMSQLFGYEDTELIVGIGDAYSHNVK